MSEGKKQDSDVSKTLDWIEKAVLTSVKPYGFRKHGRTLHRFVDGDISQVVGFQLGQAYRGETHLLWVNVGIRVPECMNRSFSPEETPKKYYHEYDCNIRSRLGLIEGKEEACFDLRTDAEPILEEILRQVQNVVIPAFEVLSSREAILEARRNYPNFDILNRHLILLEEAMIYGRSGDTQRASETFNRYYQLFGSGQLVQKDPNAIRNHLNYLNGLAGKLGINIKGERQNGEE